MGRSVDRGTASAAIVIEMTQGTLQGLVACSFCGKPQGQVSTLIKGPDGAYICEACVNLCREILEERNQPVE